MSTFHRVEVPVEIRAPIAVNILIVTVDSTVSGIFMPKRRIDITVEWFAKLFEVKQSTWHARTYDN